MIAIRLLTAVLGLLSAVAVGLSLATSVGGSDEHPFGSGVAGYRYDSTPSSTSRAATERAAAVHVRDDNDQLSRLRTRPAASLLAAKAGDDALRLPARQSFGNPAKLDDHLRRHGGDFGAKSADDYAAQASDFLQRSQRQRLPTKIDADGVVRVYDPRSNTFGAYNPSGTTRTFFKPKSRTYFDRQPGSAPRP